MYLLFRVIMIWYADGLSAFSRLFCSDLNPHFAGWHSRQRRSYFALKLPGNWWILGSDGQLQSDIDTPQLEYFRSVWNNHMQDGDKVILCISQPNWIYAHKYKKYGENMMRPISFIFSKRSLRKECGHKSLSFRRLSSL